MTRQPKLWRILGAFLIAAAVWIAFKWKQKNERDPYTRMIPMGRSNAHPENQ